MDGGRIFTMRPQYSVRAVDQAGTLTVQRMDFLIVPDFGGTAHAYCGTSLDSSIGDLLEW